MYNSYEEYMKNVLGVNVQNNTYRESEDNYYSAMNINQNMQEVNKLYPEIYSLIYPMVQKVCSRRNGTDITEEGISQMVEEIYSVIEPGDDIIENNTPQKNGDVRNPRAKETRRPPSKNNYLLKDLIRILILRELLSGGGGSGGNFPGRPGPRPRPGMGGAPVPPIMRPGNPRMF